MIFGSLEDGDDGEHNGIGFVEISESFTKRGVFSEEAPFDGV